MYYVDLSTEEIAANFTELARFEPFYNHAGSAWCQRVLGTCLEFFVLDQQYLRDDPASTALSHEENIAKHWFQDVSHVRTKYLFKALNEGLIDQETYSSYAQEDVRIDCREGELLHEYRMVCPSCGRAFNIYTPANRSFSTAGTVPSCPFCADFSVFAANRNPFAPQPEHEALTLEMPVCGTVYLFDQFRLYPQVEGESDEERQDRLVSIVLQECSEYAAAVGVPVEERERIVRALYARSDRLLHLARPIIELFGAASSDEHGDERRKELWTCLEQVSETDSGPAAMSHFNVNVNTPTAVHMHDGGPYGHMLRVDEPAGRTDNPLIGVMRNGMNMGMFEAMNAMAQMQPAPAVPLSQVSQEEPAKEPAQESSPKRFCPECGVKVTGGKFCPECGSPLG